MNRIEALTEVNKDISILMEKLQKSGPGDAINIADPFWDTECFHSLVNSADEAVLWIEAELKSERAEADFQENEMLPSEGDHVGARVGE